MDTFLNLNSFAGIVGVLGAIISVIILTPILQPRFNRLGGKIRKLSFTEITYLTSLIKDLEEKNRRNRWSNRFYIELDTELQDRHDPYNIPPAFYIVNAINRHLKDQDFNNLSNVEKIDSSRGTTYKSLESALSNAQDNATVIIGPPGSGKTVSLRNLAIKYAKKRLSSKLNKTPIFVNLGYYTGSDDDDGKVEEFESFLEKYFSQSGFQKFLSGGDWERLLRQSRCIFILDGIDELPRNPKEYDERVQKIQKFIQGWPNVQFVLSCRELDYNPQLTFQQILIKPFDRKHIRLYLKKYFDNKLFKSIFHRVEESASIFELSKNPFYLDLICFYFKETKRIPENKTVLFNFITDEFVKRETQKWKVEDLSTFKEDFVKSISHLANFLAVSKMTTTIKLDEYKASIARTPDYQKRIQMIQYAEKGGLLDFSEMTGEVRFIHNRFLEYFSSHYILENYRTQSFLLPNNFFTNIWWKETILFIAGLENDVNGFIKSIIIQRDKLTHRNLLIEQWLKLEMTIIAFECMYSNVEFLNGLSLNWSNQQADNYLSNRVKGTDHLLQDQQLSRESLDLYNQVRDTLVQAYNEGNTLEKAKVLTALKFDASKEASEVIENALTNESHWVSERAFFIVSDGHLKIQMTSTGILREFRRFFLEGRLFETIIPIIQSSRKSLLIRFFLPVFFLLVVVNIVALGGVLYVFYAFFRHVVFGLEYAFTVECLGCLFSICFWTYTILHFLFHNDYPIQKKFLYVSPLATFAYLLVFYMPSNILVRIVAGFLGLLMGYIYYRFYKRPNESEFSLGHVTSFLFGFSLVILWYNFSVAAEFLKNSLFLPSESSNSFFSKFSSIISPYTPYLLAIFLVTGMIILARFILNQAIMLKKLSENRKMLDKILLHLGQKTLTGPMVKFNQIFKFLDGAFEEMPVLWAKITLLKDCNQKLKGYLRISEEAHLEFLNLLTTRTNNVNFKDAIYQLMEEEGNNYRRAIE